MHIFASNVYVDKFKAIATLSVIKRPAKFFAMKINFIMLLKSFNVCNEREKCLSRKFSTTCFTITIMFCNICKFCVRSKQFPCIFNCHSKEARDWKDFAFLSMKCLWTLVGFVEMQCFFLRNFPLIVKQMEESKLDEINARVDMTHKIKKLATRLQHISWRA